MGQEATEISDMISAAFGYRVVDVFTRRALEGNALAVFPDTQGLDEATMQRIARELNLPETTFVLPATLPGCEARIRIFTPAREIPFAGHPTLGTTFVLLESGRLPASAGSFRLEERIGPVTVDIGPESPPFFWLRTPTINHGPAYARERCASALGLGVDDLIDIEPRLLSAGNPLIFVALRDCEAVDRAWLDLGGIRALRGADSEPCCVYVFARTATGVYSRMFAPQYGISEDPATGSAAGPLAAYMIRNGLLSPADGTAFVCEQGTRMGRRSLLHVRLQGEDGNDGIFVGGHVTPVATATMHLELPA
jgi:trans-2,3-dihydro-3-hydroxyanthranilate isomerase